MLSFCCPDVSGHGDSRCLCGAGSGTVVPAISHWLLGYKEDQGRRFLPTYISGEAVSGALILVPSFKRLQKSSSIWTPGYGDAPAKKKGLRVGRGDGVSHN